MLQDIKNLELLTSIRTLDLSEPKDLYFKLAEELLSTKKNNDISRANFILAQVNGEDGKTLFNEHREDWGIWNFDDEILKAEDFKRGFLFCFRDHSTSWADNQKAKAWFLNSSEAPFVRRYEFWTCDSGFDECIEVKEGNYKEILLSLLNDRDYEVLASPVFSHLELTDFIKTYDPKNGDFEIDEIIVDYITLNPNYRA